jgi:hypothetical protein
VYAVVGVCDAAWWVWRVWSSDEMSAKMFLCKEVSKRMICMIRRIKYQVDLPLANKLPNIYYSNRGMQGSHSGPNFTILHIPPYENRCMLSHNSIGFAVPNIFHSRLNRIRSVQRVPSLLAFLILKSCAYIRMVLGPTILPLGAITSVTCAPVSDVGKAIICCP